MHPSKTWCLLLVWAHSTLLLRTWLNAVYAIFKHFLSILSKGELLYYAKLTIYINIFCVLLVTVQTILSENFLLTDVFPLAARAQCGNDKLIIAAQCSRAIFTLKEAKNRCDFFASYRLAFYACG